MARSYRAWLSRGLEAGVGLGDLARAAARGRSHLGYRLAMVGDGLEEVAGRLEVVGAGEGAGLAPVGSRRLVFVFAPHGTQWPGMARGLLETAPVFAAAIEACEAALRPYVSWSLKEKLSGADESWMDALDVVQPVLFSVQVALARQWEALGVRPDAVVGHSMGEIAAAVVAGCLELDDAARIVCHRTRLLQQVAGEGASAVVGLPIDQARDALRGFEGQVFVGASNSPLSTLLSGDPDALEAVLEPLEARGIFCGWGVGNVAAHSPRLKALEGALREALEGISARPAAMPFYSTLTGDRLEEAPGVDHWVRQMLEPVLFWPAVKRLAEADHDLYVELSPHPALFMVLSECLRHLGREEHLLPSLKRGGDDRTVMLETLGELYTKGFEVDWTKVYPGPGRHVTLPTYPWQKERHWIDVGPILPVTAGGVAGLGMEPGLEGVMGLSGAGVAGPGGVAGVGVGSSRHPLLGVPFTTAMHAGTRFWQGLLSPKTVPWLPDHGVEGAVVLPGAAFLEMALAAVGEAAGQGGAGEGTPSGAAYEVEGVSFRQALAFPPGAGRTVQLALREEEAGRFTLQVSSLETGDGPRTWTLHATGALRRVGKGGPDPEVTGAASPVEPLETLQARCPEPLPAGPFYQALRDRGLEYGPSFQGLEAVFMGQGEGLGRLRTTAEVGAHAGRYQLHPALLDAGFHVLAAALARSGAAGEAGAFLPIRVGKMRIDGDPGSIRWSHVRHHAGRDLPEGELEGDVRLLDETGAVVVSIDGLRMRRLAAATREAEKEELFLAHTWRRAASPEPEARAPRAGRWLLLEDRTGVADGLQARLEAAGEAVVRVAAGRVGAERKGGGDRYVVDPEAPDGFDRLFREVFVDGAPCLGVVHLWSLDLPGGDETTLESLEQARKVGVTATLHLVQALRRTGWRAVPRLWLVTRGAWQVAGDVGAGAGAGQPGNGQAADSLSPAQAPLWGLASTIGNECPELRCAAVDLPTSATGGEGAASWTEESTSLAQGKRSPRTAPPSIPPASGGEEGGACPLVNTHGRDPESLGELDALMLELQGSSREEQVALRPDGRYVARLTRQADPGGDEVQVPAGDRPFRLEVSTPGTLDHLRLRPLTRRPPGPGEIEVQVEAAGLNFFDVMKALGIYPGQAEQDIPLGGECAGRVVAVGEGVEDFVVGQEMVAIGAPALASFLTLPAAFAAPKPATLSMLEAASSPGIFMKSWYALHHVGRIQAGDRVLIHSAAGGTGLAAVQLALRAGAEVFATAGSEEKREFLRGLGIRHVMDSRSLEFADQVMAATHGEGVDLVLSSLSGEAVERSLAVLAEDGRYLELGKRDIYADRQLGLGHFRRNLTYSVVGFAGMAQRRPERFAALLREVMAALGEGGLKPLPVRATPVSRAGEAFRTMAQARHVGRLAVTMVDEEARITMPRSEARICAPDGAYLVTGGLGGLGLRVARWLVDQGARHLALVGRKGAVTAAQKEAVAGLEAAGARVLVLRADLADPADCDRLFTGIDLRLPPLKGVVHAAGVLDDGMLEAQDLARFRKVMAPKVEGAWNLHTRTRHRSLDFFVLFSSAATLLGSPGQGNYCAANAFLDALAPYRRSLGMPALAVNWGAFAEVGLAAEAGRVDRLELRGLRSLTPDEGLEILGRLITGGAARAGVLPLNVRQWIEAFPQVVASPYLSELVSSAARQTRSTGDPALLASLREAGPEGRKSRLEAFIRAQVAAVVRLDAQRIDRQTPFKTLGIDSLMGLEVRNRLEAGLGLTLAATLLWTWPTVAALAAHLAEKLGDLSGTPDRPDPSLPLKGTPTRGGEADAARAPLPRPSSLPLPAGGRGQGRGADDDPSDLSALSDEAFARLVSQSLSSTEEVP